MSHRILALALLALVTLALVACGTADDAAPSTSPATITIRVTIVDEATEQPRVGSVSLDGQPVAQHISTGEVAVPADLVPHILRVEAAGCQSWTLSLRSPALRDHRITGPARLRCGAAGQLRG